MALGERRPLLIDREKEPPAQGLRCCFDDVPLTWGETAFGLVGLSLLVAIIVDIATTQHLLSWLEYFLRWLENCNVLVLVTSFVAFAAVWIVCLVPMTLVIVGGGYVCALKFSSTPLALAVALSMSCTAFFVGGTIAFLLARHVFGGCSQRFIRHFKALQCFDLALKHNGRKMNLLLRVNPILPYNVFNYAMGLTSSSLADYCVGMLGGIPYISLFVYVGLLIDSLTDISDVYGRTSTGWICAYIALGVCCVISLYLLYRYTKAETAAIMSVHGAPAAGSDASFDTGGSRRIAGEEAAACRVADAAGLQGSNTVADADASEAAAGPAATQYRTFGTAADGGF